MHMGMFGKGRSVEKGLLGGHVPNGPILSSSGTTLTEVGKYASIVFFGGSGARTCCEVTEEVSCTLRGRIAIP